ncbi:MmgE/PrpD family protein [Pararhizobium polonicum]|uniref:MmgE/PrpD family protein n=1 Tax=Pararhizobium polonicum TaxID=1612624 RepID=UPI00083ADCFD|nr:MmgE/PrpD family protein [Pararhizobium polonicum]
MSETRILAEFATELTFENIPAATRAQAKIVLLDGLSCLLAGCDGPLGRSAGKMVEELGGIEQATSFASGRQLATRDAAYANAMALYSVGLNDIHKPSGTHPGGCIIPATLAMAEQERVSGADLLTALVVGYEVNGRIGRAVKQGHRKRGFHPTGTCGSFGSAAAAAKIRRRNQEGHLNVLGIAGSQASGLYEFHQTGSTTMVYHAGRAAQNGIEANMLNDAGLTGPHSVLEGIQGFFVAMSSSADTIEISNGLGRKFMIDETSLRPNFGCNSTKSTSIALADILKSEKIPVRDVASIEISLNSLPARDNDIPLIESLIDARLSVQYNAALVLAAGNVVVRDVTEADTLDPAILCWMPKIIVRPDDALSRYACRIRVALDNGRVFVGQDAGARGDPSDPLDWRQVSHKAASLVNLNINNAHFARLAAIIQNIEAYDVAGLVTALAAIRSQEAASRGA